MSYYGDRLRELMGRGSQADLARRAGVPQPTIQRILSGETQNPSANTLRKLARGLNVPIASLTTARPGAPIPENQRGGPVECQEPMPVPYLSIDSALTCIASRVDGADVSIRSEIIRLVASYLATPRARAQIAAAIVALTDGSPRA